MKQVLGTKLENKNNAACDKHNPGEFAVSFRESVESTVLYCACSRREESPRGRKDPSLDVQT